MSTNSNIRINRKDGTTTGIYCHYDGYIEHTGVILQLAYNTAEKVEELLKLGDLSQLNYYTDPKEKKHTFENPDGCTCVAYHRDRGEEFKQTICDAEYIYTYDEIDACWLVTIKEFTEGTPGTTALDLNFIETSRTALLIDEIIRLQPDELYGMGAITANDRWQSDIALEPGKIVDACIIKAKEARQKLIEEKRAALAAYAAYYD